MTELQHNLYQQELASILYHAGFSLPAIMAGAGLSPAEVVIALTTEAGRNCRERGTPSKLAAKGAA
jgi:hypothetical protein